MNRTPSRAQAAPITGTANTARTVLSAIAALACSACASVAVTDSAIEDRTAFALGLQAGSFTISNRQDDGVRTQYQVQTKAGQRYSCYVAGSFGMTGRIVSDAICNKPGEAPKNPLLGR